MGATTTPKMRVAQSLLWTGITAAEASRQSGITEPSISKSALCQEIIEVVRIAKMQIANDTVSTDNALLAFFENSLLIPGHHAEVLLASRPAKRFMRLQKGTASC
jgi:hypothetical protein